MTNVTVLSPDLTAINAALESVYHMLLAQDMVDAYRKLNSQNRSSPMTLQVKRALDLTENYLAQGGETE